MALTRPILYSQVAFDATQEHIFTFNVIGGDQVVANTLTIINNTTSEQVYSEREETFTLTHTLPADSLQNGVYYAATLTTENASGEISVASNTIQFYCYTTPIFNFTNLTTGANLTTSSYNFEVSYNQIESEALEQYSFNLYDYSSNLIATSGILYTNSTTVPFLTQYTFMGFSNNTSYYIECTGITVGGTQITTGLISFGVNYNASSTKLNLINNCIGGYVYVASAPIAIFGTSNPDPPTYIIDGENSYVSLENNGEYVEWDNGFTTSTTDWTLSIWGKNFVEGENIAILSNTSGGNINIEYIINNDEAYYSLTATNNSSNNYYYKIYSNKIIPPNENDEIMVWIRRVNNIYDLFIFNNTSKYITKEGEIVTFYDAIGDREIYDLTVAIDPVQDLHGYDAPWPPGGGKNKLPFTAETKTNSGITFTVNSDGSVSVSGTASDNAIYNYASFTPPSGSYVLNGNISGSSSTTYRMRYRVNGGSWVYVNTTSDTNTITLDGSSTFELHLLVLSGQTVSGIYFYPMLRLSSEANATFAPYSNLCPISGWTEVNVQRTGRNLLDTKNYAPSSLSSGGISITQNPDGTFYASGTATGVVNLWLRGSWGGTDPVLKLYAGKTYFIKDCTLYSGTSVIGSLIYMGNSGTYTPTVDTVVTGVRASTPNGTTLNLTIYPYVTDSSDTEWQEFGNTYTIQLGQTVYGGTPDVITGGMVIDMENIPSYNGETLPGEWISDRDVYSAGGTPTIGAQVVYKLATPIEIQLDDPVTIETLLGTNNMWTNTGKITITYLQ